MSNEPKWKRHVLALGATALVFAVALLGINKMLSDPEAGPPTPGGQEGIGELVATSRVCQTFVAQHGNLSQVKVKLSTFGRSNTGPFFFHLYASADPAHALFTHTPDAYDVVDFHYHVFPFAPIRDSAGRSYRFCLEAPEAGVLNSITAIGNLSNTYPHGQATFRDMWGQAAGVLDLDFHLGYRLPIWKQLAVSLERLASHKSLLYGDKRLHALLGVAYLALLYGFFARFVAKRL